MRGLGFSVWSFGFIGVKGVSGVIDPQVGLRMFGLCSRLKLWVCGCAQGFVGLGTGVCLGVLSGLDMVGSGIVGQPGVWRYASAVRAALHRFGYEAVLTEPGFDLGWS